RTRSAQAAGNPQRPQQCRLRHATAIRSSRRWRNDSDFAPLPQGCRPRRHDALPALRLRRLRPFDPRRVWQQSLVDRGFIYAIAHVRGGSEKGWRWYREGKLAKKMNTFTDFIAASEYLSKSGWSAPGKIVAEGSSAGGTLIGAVGNMRPDLYAGLIAGMPFVDVLNTMLDETLPLTPPEWPEWGDPIRDAAAFRTILAYSPYENVHVQSYPAILALAGLTHPRVLYWEPAKWIARLRRLRTDDNLIALRTNLEAGHAGAAGRFDRLKEVALAYAFAIKIAGAAL